MRRLSRPCYDKAHRCPGWAGGGMKYAKTTRCADGRIEVAVVEPPVSVDGVSYGEPSLGHPGTHPWRPGRCNTCNVITIPFALRRLDPTWWPSTIRSIISNWRYRRSWR